MLTRTEILAKIPWLALEEISIEEWGGPVFVREMTGGERDRFELMLLEGRRANFRAMLAAFTVCDDGGKRIFVESDVAALAGQPASVLDRISVVALRLNQLQAGDIEAARKNSEGGPSNGSP